MGISALLVDITPLRQSPPFRRLWWGQGLAAFVAIGSVLAIVFSGPLGHVRRQGLVVAWAVVGWGAGILGFGVVLMAAGTTSPDHVIDWTLIASAACLAFAGGCDSLSSVFRNTILQSATPDRLQGRRQPGFVRYNASRS